ncbi:MAG: hypothetical protein WCK96_08700 [Methylococcales bacterium]
MYAKNPSLTDAKLRESMKDIQPSFDDGMKLPTNPSDSNEFRLHELFIA